MSRLFRWQTAALAQQTGTSLVSAYVAPDDDISSVVALVRDAKQCADDPTPAEAALEYFEQRDTVDDNGVALFVDRDSTTVFDTDLSPAVDKTLVRISTTFHLDPLTIHRRFEGRVGIIAVERGDALLGELRNKRINRIKRKTGYVPSQHGAGGQSQQRFERRIEEQKNSFFERVIRRMKSEYLDNGQPTVDHLLVGGSSETVRAFKDALPPALQNCLVATVGINIDTRPTTATLNTIYKKAQSDIAEAEREEEYEVVEQVRAAVGRGSPPVATTQTTVEQALEYRAVDTLLCTDEHDYETLQTARRMAAEQGGSFVLVERDWDGGQWMREQTDGCAALLRHNIN